MSKKKTKQLHTEYHYLEPQDPVGGCGGIFNRHESSQHELCIRHGALGFDPRVAKDIFLFAVAIRVLI